MITIALPARCDSSQRCGTFGQLPPANRTAPHTARVAVTAPRACLRFDGAVFQHDDAIGHAHAGEAVRDQHDSLAAAELLEALERFVLGADLSA